VKTKKENPKFDPASANNEDNKYNEQKDMINDEIDALIKKLNSIKKRQGAALTIKNQTK